MFASGISYGTFVAQNRSNICQIQGLAMGKGILNLNAHLIVADAGGYLLKARANKI